MTKAVYAQYRPFSDVMNSCKIIFALMRQDVQPPHNSIRGRNRRPLKRVGLHYVHFGGGGGTKNSNGKAEKPLPSDLRRSDKNKKTKGKS